MRRRADTQRPVRRRERDAEPVASVDRAQGVGHAPGEAQLAEEGKDCGGAKARRRHAPDVARRNTLPVDGRGGLRTVD